MEIIEHRKNTIAELEKVPLAHGVEIDIRSSGNRIILQHDPFIDGENFEDWLEIFNHKTLILNVKEEGLEQHILNILEKRNIKDFFFLDQSFPFLIKTAKTGENRCAVRYSEYEAIETILNLSGLIQWVWVDCFTKFPITKASYQLLKQHHFKLCLVSPELQGRFDDSEIDGFKDWLKQNDITLDAVCTKKPDIWHVN